MSDSSIVRLTPSRLRRRGLTLQLLIYVVLPLTVLLIAVPLGSMVIHQQAMRVLVGERDARATRAYPLDKAIGLLQRLNAVGTDPDSKYVAEDITGRLQEKYPGYLRPEIVAVRIVQTSARVWLEVTEEEERDGYLKDQVIFRSDLAFIITDTDPDGLLFPPVNDVRENARKFIEEFDDYSIIMTTRLFHVAACKEIDARYQAQRNPDEGEAESTEKPRGEGAG